MNGDSMSMIERAMEKKAIAKSQTKEVNIPPTIPKVSLTTPKAPPPLYASSIEYQELYEPGLDIGQMFKSIWSYRGLAFTLILIFATILVGGNKSIFPDQYEASASVRIKSVTLDSEQQGGRNVSIVPEEVLSTQVLEKVINELDLAKREKIPAIEAFLTKIGVQVKTTEDSSGIIRWLKDEVQIHEEQSGNVTKVFTVSLVDKDPHTISVIVNSIVKHYLALHHEFEVVDSHEAVSFLQPQMQAAEKVYDEATQALTNFQTENADYLIPTETIEGNLTRLQQEYVESETRAVQLAEVNKRLVELVKIVPTFIVVGASGGATSLAGHRERIQTELALFQNRYSENHPTLKGLRNQLVNLKQTMQNNPDLAGGQMVNPDYLRIHQQIDENEAERTVLERRVPAIKQDIIRMSEHLKHVKSAQAGLLALQGEWDKTYTEYQQVRGKFVEYKTKADAQSNDIGHDMTILDYASVPTLPVSASRQKMMIVGLIGAFAIGLGIVFLRSMFTGWKTPENQKKVGLLRTIFVNTLGILWFLVIIGYIVITPYI